MKASEVILRLQELIAKHGDLGCMYYDDCGENDVGYIGHTKIYDWNDSVFIMSTVGD